MGLAADAAALEFLMIDALVLLVIVGLVLYLVENYLPIAQPIKLVIQVIVVLFLILYLLQLFGLTSMPPLRMR